MFLRIAALFASSDGNGLSDTILRHLTKSMWYDSSMKYDFVALGDIVIDAFIKLEDAEQLMDHGVRELCVRFGDKVPYADVTEVLAVGNATNAAVAASKIGLSSAFITWLGSDEN